MKGGTKTEVGYKGKAEESIKRRGGKEEYREDRKHYREKGLKKRKKNMKKNKRKERKGLWIIHF